MEDMATGEIRISILWEWLHKQRDADRRSVRRRRGLLPQLCRGCSTRSTRSCSKAGEPRRPRRLEDRRRCRSRGRIVRAYVESTTFLKLPWFIDLLNVNLGHQSISPTRRRRIQLLLDAFGSRGRTRDGQPRLQGQQLDVTAPNMFAGSILDLEPDTAYEAQFVLTDPDGVTGESPKTVTVRRGPSRCRPPAAASITSIRPDSRARRSSRPSKA